MDFLVDSLMHKVLIFYAEIRIYIRTLKQWVVKYLNVNVYSNLSFSVSYDC